VGSTRGTTWKQGESTEGSSAAHPVRRPLWNRYGSPGSEDEATGLFDADLTRADTMRLAQLDAALGPTGARRVPAANRIPTRGHRPAQSDSDSNHRHDLPAHR